MDKNIQEGLGDNVAVKFMDKAITYRQLYESVNRLGNSLKELGVEPLDRVPFE